MYTIMKSILSHPLQLLKAIMLMSVVSIPLVTVGLANYLSYQSFQSSLDNTSFEVGLSLSDEDSFLNQSGVIAALAGTELVDSELAIYVSSLRTTITANADLQNCLLVGLSSFHSIQGAMNGTSVGLLWDDITSLELSLNDRIEVSKPFSASLTIGAVVNLTSSEIGFINSLVSKLGRPSDFLIVLGWIGQIRELASGLSDFHQEEINVDSYYLFGRLRVQNLAHGSFDGLVVWSNKAMSEIKSVLEEYGEVEILWTPATHLESLQARNVGPEARVNLVVWPVFAIAVLFLYLAIWIMTLSRKRDYGLMLMKGTSRRQISIGIIATDILIGTVSGVLSIPFAWSMSSILLNNRMESQALGWFEFAIRTHVVLIAGAVILAVILVIVSSGSSCFYLNRLDTKNLLSRNDNVGKKQGQSKAYVIGILIVMTILLETSLNYPVMSYAIRLSAENPGLLLLVRMFTYAELFLTLTSPIVMGYCTAKLMPLWQNTILGSPRRPTRMSSISNNLLVKGFAIPPKRSVSIGGLVLLTLFCSGFLNGLYTTGTLMVQTENALEIGGDLRIHIQGEALAIQEVAESLQVLDGVELVSICSTDLVSVQSFDGHIHPGRLFIVDPEYFEISSIAANYMGNTLELNSSILLSQGFANVIQPAGIITLYWDYENSSELNVAGSFTFLPGFQDHVFHFQEQDSIGWALLITIECFELLMPEKRMDDYYLFLDSEGKAEETYPAVESVLDSKFAQDPSIRWSIETSDSDPESEAIWESYVTALSCYLLIMGTICIALSIVLTVGETKHEILVAGARGASYRLVLHSAIMPYLVLVLPLIMIGSLMSVAYVYALQLAPILLDWSIRYGGMGVILPFGYRIVPPVVLFVSFTILIFITVVVIGYSTHITMKKRTLDQDLVR